MNKKDIEKEFSWMNIDGSGNTEVFKDKGGWYRRHPNGTVELLHACDVCVDEKKENEERPVKKKSRKKPATKKPVTKKKTTPNAEKK